jgi:hypothetical protein
MMVFASGALKHFFHIYFISVKSITINPGNNPHISFWQMVFMPHDNKSYTSKSRGGASPLLVVSPDDMTRFWIFTWASNSRSIVARITFIK